MHPTKDLHAIYEAITTERIRQEHLRLMGKFAATCATTGVNQMTEFECFSVLGEEVGEVSRALLDGADVSQVITELIQTAAVCVAWIERLSANMVEPSERVEHAALQAKQ
jgi:hypothetical protein